MKIFEISIPLLLLLVCLQVPCYGQSEKNIINNSVIIPLKVGKNPSIQLETMVIRPVNLFRQSEPISKASPRIQLELNIVENTDRYTTFLWNSEASDGPRKTNYPKAYHNYSFDLKIHNEEVALVVEKLDFGKAVFIDLGQTAVIGNLSILFENAIGEWTADSNGNQTDAFITYTIALTDGSERKTLSFISVNTYAEKELSLVWREYTILILEDSEEAIQLMVVTEDTK